MHESRGGGARQAGVGERILVIRLGALGDFVYSLGPMAAIRKHHKGARITLLTTAPFVDFGRASGYFDEVWVDSRPKPWNLAGWLGLRRRLRAAAFHRVYDLQASERTGYYFRMLGPGRRPQWSGLAPGCSHPDSNPDRPRQHTVVRQREQLRLAGIPRTPDPDLAWATADVTGFDLPAPYVLLVPGCSPVKPLKRWPVSAYAELAARLARAGATPVVLGAKAEEHLAAAIRDACPTARDLTGRTSLVQIAALGRGAAAAAGNDTGPLHIVAVTRAPTVLILSELTHPTLRAPLWKTMEVLYRPALADLPVAEAAAALARLTGGRVAP